MIKFFRGSGVGPVLLVILAALALWSEYFITPPSFTGASDGEPMPLWGIILPVLERSPLFAVILAFVMMLIVAMVMVRFNTAVFFIPRRTYLPALLYILLYSLFPAEMVYNPALPAALLVLAGLWRMVSSYRINGMVFNFFDAALLISAAGMLYTGSLWLILLVFVGALIFRSPDLRELTVTVAGVILPWTVLYAVWFVTGGDLGELTEVIRHNLFDKLQSFVPGRTLLILLVIALLNFVPAVFSMIREMPTYKIRSRKTFELFLWMIFMCVAVFVLVPAVSCGINAIAAIPVAFIMANYLAFTRRIIIAEILLWLMVVMLVVSRLWP